MSKDNRENGTCQNADCCDLIQAERELWLESLRAHLSEQRHDFFNLLQVLYGYTQLKKHDKVLAYISSYCRLMENIGRLYNGKCIKLADLLYTKIKEADSLDLSLEVIADIGFEPSVRLLDADSVLYATDRAISALYYMLDSGGYKGAVVICSLKENQDDFVLEIYCRDIREEKLSSNGLGFPEKEMYWKKLERDVSDLPTIMRYCKDNGIEIKMLRGNTDLSLTVFK